jgi:predicted transcriptional regulator
VDKVAHIFLKDQKLVARLELVATSEHRTKTAIVVRALERYFDQQEQRGAE